MRTSSARIAEIVCAVSLLLIYTATLAPSITWSHYGADGGDLITAVARGSLPHPPGFPTYLLFGELFNRIPCGDSAWRLNLMSAVMAASAAGFVVATARRLLDASEQSIIAICAGICLGLTPLVWSQALIAEVYALAVCFAALVAYLALRGAPAWLLGFIWGIGLGAHPVIACLVPLVAWSAWQNRSRRVWGLTEAALGSLIGWGIVYGPALIVRGSVPSPWGEVDTPTEWWAFVTGQMYHGYLFGLSPNVLPQRILAWFGIVVRQFTPIGAALALFGWLEQWETRRALAIVTVIVFGGISLFAVAYNTADSVVYLTLALPLAALWLARGLSRTAMWLRGRVRWGSALILLLPLLQLVLFWSEMDLHTDRTAMIWADRVLSGAPPRAILVTAEDAHTFTLWYVHDVLGKRPDVIVVDHDLLGIESYHKMVMSELGVDISFDDVARVTGRPLLEIDASAMRGKP